jgi:hypothetical protein
VPVSSAANGLPPPFLYLPSVSCNQSHTDVDKLPHLNLHPASTLTLPNQSTLSALTSNHNHLGDFYGVLSNNNDFVSSTMPNTFHDSKSVKIILPSADSCQSKHLMHLANCDETQLLSDQLLQNTLLGKTNNSMTENCKFIDDLHNQLLHQKLLGNPLLSVTNPNDFASLDSQANSSTQSTNYLGASDCASSERTATPLSKSVKF